MFFCSLFSWLLTEPLMQVRSSFPSYLERVEKYFLNLLPQLIDLQASNGGPIIAWQIENEYGSYGDDRVYTNFLESILKREGVTELLFTSDNGSGIMKGPLPNILATVNFQELEHGKLLFHYLKHSLQPKMPLMVMEFWSGWFDHWKGKHEVWPVEG